LGEALIAYREIQYGIFAHLPVYFGCIFPRRVGLPGIIRIMVSDAKSRRIEKMLATILIIVLVLLLIGSLPVYPYSRSWGYGGSGMLGFLLLLLILALLLGWI
jgi:hypothetical protein